MIRLGVITLSIILFGCGGGGGASSSATISSGPVTISGSVQDGYISGALVFIDTNANYIFDGPDELHPSATTNELGEFNLTYPSGVPGGKLVSIGGTDSDTKLTDDELIYVKRDKDFSNTNLITPLSSVAAYLGNSNDNLFAI